jgi:hypothetical protein
MAVADGAKILKSVLFVSSDVGTSGADASPLVWTLDGQWVVDIDYVAANIDGSDVDNGTSRKLIAIRRDGKVVKEFPCVGCAELAPIGGGKVLIGIDRAFEELPSQGSPFPGDDVPLMTVDLNSKIPPILMHSQLPEFLPGYPNNPVYNSDGSLATYTYDFVAGLPGEVVVLRSTLESLGPENLVLLTADGTAKTLGSTHSSVPVVTVADVSGPVDGKQSVVFDGGWDKWVPNEDAGHIAVLDSSTGALTYPDTSAMFPASEMPSSTVSAEARDLWWGPNRQLYGLFRVSSEAQDGTITNVVPLSMWRLVGMRWTKVANEQFNGDDIVKLRMFGDGSRAMAVSGNGLQPGNGYTLYFQPKVGNATKVSDDVTSLLAPGA